VAIPSVTNVTKPRATPFCHVSQFRADVTNYTGSVRVRVAYHFDCLSREFLAPDGPKALEQITCPALLTLHACSDTMTEPHGSTQLFERAACERKILVLISGPSGPPCVTHPRKSQPPPRKLGPLHPCDCTTSDPIETSRGSAAPTQRDHLGGYAH
jgi:hypothetical protein